VGRNRKLKEVTLFYHAATNGFYSPEFGPVPEGSVEVTAEEHIALLMDQSEGKRIVAGQDGRPMSVAPPESNGLLRGRQ
jgi:hypothetical protein